jgi:hypothetical protein
MTHLLFKKKNINLGRVMGLSSPKADSPLLFWSQIIKLEYWVKFFNLGLPSRLEWNLRNEDIENISWS